MLADGVQGMLSGAAIEHFGLEPENPQIYALGVKEVWRVARPLDRVMHTIGWPLKPQARYREFGGTFVYPMGPDTICLGLVVGLDYADASLSVHDLLQERQGATRSSAACSRAASASPGVPRRFPRAASGRSRRACRRPAP